MADAAPAKGLTPLEKFQKKRARESSTHVTFSSGSSNVTSAEGIVTRVSEQGSGKQTVTVLWEKFSKNNDPSTIVLPIGIVQLPTARVTPSPDEVASKNTSPATYTLDILPTSVDPSNVEEVKNANLKVMLNCGVTEFSHFKDPQEKIPITVGSRVYARSLRVSYLSSDASKTGRLFFNAHGLKVVGDAVCKRDVAKTLTAAARSHEVQSRAALLWSTTQGGYTIEGFPGPMDDVAEQQAAGFAETWNSMPTLLGEKLERVLEDTNPASSLLKHKATAVKACTGKDFVEGSNFGVAVEPIYGQETPYSAPILLSGEKSETGYFTEALLSSSESYDSLPKRFVEGKIKAVSNPENSSLMKMAIELYFINNKATALAAVAADEVPVVSSIPDTEVGVMASTKHIGPWMGTTSKSKVKWAFPALIKNCDGVLIAAVFPNTGDSTEISCHFASLDGINITSGLMKGVLVSMNWYNTKVTGSKGVFVEGKVTDVEDQIPAGKTAVEMPALLSHGYQSLLQSWDKDDLIKTAADAGEDLQVRILYDGYDEAVRNNPSLAMSASTGEAHLESLEAASKDIKNWIKNSTLPYALLRKPFTP